jgi:hypothetical protein
MLSDPSFCSRWITSVRVYLLARRRLLKTLRMFLDYCDERSLHWKNPQTRRKELEGGLLLMELLALVTEF